MIEIITSITMSLSFVVAPQLVAVRICPSAVEYPGSFEFQGKQIGETYDSILSDMPWSLKKKIYEVYEEPFGIPNHKSQIQIFSFLAK